MNEAPRTAAEGPLTEWLLRAFAVLIYGLAVSNLAGAWLADHSRWTILALLVTEGYTLLMVILAYKAQSRDLSLLAVLATGFAMFYFALLSAEGTSKWVPELVGLALQVAGMGWQFASKIALGRSFGLLPAQRTLVLIGPYRLVRHPIYFGYLVSHIGFFLANASWRNAAIFLVLYAAQVYRIHREEQVLAQNADYRNYQQRVRSRLVPFIY